MTDFAQTAHAQQQRQSKAKALARHLYDQGEYDPVVISDLPESDRRGVEKAAGVRKSSKDTWDEVVGLLLARQDFDLRQSAAPPPPAAPLALVPADPGGDTRPCTHYDDGTGNCDATHDTRSYLTGIRCPIHTPAALAGVAETTPDPTRTLAATRALAGVSSHAPQSLSSLNDARAIASGKRRSSPNTYRAARAEVG